jgi:hypothetical protein
MKRRVIGRENVGAVRHEGEGISMTGSWRRWMRTEVEGVVNAPDVWKVAKEAVRVRIEAILIVAIICRRRRILVAWVVGGDVMRLRWLMLTS